MINHTYHWIVQPHLPLDCPFSRLLARLAPYPLGFYQIEYFLKIPSQKDWQPSDLKLLRYVYSIKKRVLDIAERCGGLSFVPQSFLVSVFLGEATRASMSVTQPLASNQIKNATGGRRLGVSYSSKPSIRGDVGVDARIGQQSINTESYSSSLSVCFPAGTLSH